MKVLLDTCVLSEIRHPNGHPAVSQAVREFSDSDVFISAISIGEIAKGVALLPDGARKSELLSWYSGLEQGFGDRILKIDAGIARIWGEVTALAQQRGKQISVTDGLIAATARAHGLHVMTRNVADFTPSGALLLNPWPESET